MISKRLIKTVGLILGLILLATLIYLLIPRGEILFQVAPEQVTILIDNKDKKQITNGDKISLSPGQHTILVYRDEFSPSTFDVDVRSRQSTEIVSVLTPLTENAKKLLTSDKSAHVIEKFSAINMDKEVDKLRKTYPILSILPIENRNYTIRSCASKQYPGDLNKIALCVDIPGDDFKNIVKDDIRSRGFNPDDYEYVWNDYLSGVE